MKCYITNRLFDPDNDEWDDEQREVFLNKEGLGADEVEISESDFELLTDIIEAYYAVQLYLQRLIEIKETSSELKNIRSNLCKHKVNK